MSDEVLLQFLSHLMHTRTYDSAFAAASAALEAGCDLIRLVQVGAYQASLKERGYHDAACGTLIFTAMQRDGAAEMVVNWLNTDLISREVSVRFLNDLYMRAHAACVQGSVAAKRLRKLMTIILSMYKHFLLRDQEWMTAQRSPAQLSLAGKWAPRIQKAVDRRTHMGKALARHIFGSTSGSGFKLNRREKKRQRNQQEMKYRKLIVGLSSYVGDEVKLCPPQEPTLEGFGARVWANNILRVVGDVM